MGIIEKYDLAVRRGPEAGKNWVFSQQVVNIGRAEGNDIVLSDLTVSKSHCRIVHKGTCIIVENKSQSTQTYVNGKAENGAKLAHGDVLRLGNTEFHFTCLDTGTDGEHHLTGGVEDPVTAATMFVDRDALLDEMDPKTDVPTQTIDFPRLANRYSIKSKLAQRGQAVLFHGLDETSGEEVALKLFTHDVSDLVSEARFQREITILERLSHPNIVGYRGVFEDEGEWGDTKRYLVMEFLRGKNLKEYMAENPRGLPWEKAKDIFEQCLQGLIHAWSQHGIIHRDIKPSNIFILEDGTVKLIDFGISRVDSESTHTGGSGMMGSFDYMAPDFALHKESGFRGDIVSDIYSLFVCFYEMLTGSLPYPGYGERQELEYLTRWREGVSPPAHKHIVFRVIAHLSRVIDKGLSVQRNERYQSFEEVLTEVRALRNRIIHHKEEAEQYELLDGLGTGAFGEVYLGRKKSDQTYVAVKRLYSNRPGKRFVKEAAVLRQYSHPAIVKYLDYFQTESLSGARSSILILEYLQGETLNRSIAANPQGLDSERALKLFLQYLSALDFLHNAKHPIIHRDIKPSNLHVPDKDPLMAKILDMGIVKDVSGTHTSGKLPGTYYYMAPEMFTSDNRGTPQTDIYALGLSLYEALTGNPAYPRLPRNDKDAIIEMMARAQGKKQYRINYGHPAFKQWPDLINIIQKAVQHNPDGRYVRARDMWEDIAGVLCHDFNFPREKVEELRAGALAQHLDEERTRFIDPRLLLPESGVKSARKRKRRIGLAAALCALTLGACFYTWRQLPCIKPYVDKWIGGTRPAENPRVLKNESAAVPVTGKAAPGETDIIQSAQPALPAADDNKDPGLSAPVNGSRTESPQRQNTDNLAAEIRRLANDTLNAANYDLLVSEFTRTMRSYSNTMENEQAGSAELFMPRRRFWYKHISYVLEEAVLGKEEFFAVAAGQYFAAMPCYAGILGTSNQNAICETLYEDIKNALDNPEIDPRNYLPLRKSPHFKPVHDNGNKTGLYLKTVLSGLDPFNKAQFLPLQATLELKTVNQRNSARASQIDFTLVPGGKMPAAKAGDPKGEAFIPNPFYIATSETTRECMRCYKDEQADDLRAITGKGPYAESTLQEAILFCNWLSRYDGLSELYSKSGTNAWSVDLRKSGYRLPFDFEWEYAARFGFDYYTEEGRTSWSAMAQTLEKQDGLIWYYFKNEPRLPNEEYSYPLGLYDMCGNVQELCMKVPGRPLNNSGVADVGFVAMGGGVGAHALKEVMPWSRAEIKAEEKKYGFRVVRSLPCYEFTKNDSEKGKKYE